MKKLSIPFPKKQVKVALGMVASLMAADVPAGQLRLMPPYRPVVTTQAEPQTALQNDSGRALQPPYRPVVTTQAEPQTALQNDSGRALQPPYRPVVTTQAEPQTALQNDSGRALQPPYRPVVTTQAEPQNWHRHPLLAALLTGLIALSGVVFFQAAATSNQAAATRRSADLTVLTSTSSICTQHYPKGHPPFACRNAEHDLRLNP